MIKPLLLVAALFSIAQAQTVDPQLYAGMKWRLVGPMRGGRSLACVGSVQRPSEYYFGATGGGVWKTTDGGQSWSPVSDGYFTTASVGALAIAPSNPDIVVAGTGERDIRGDISHGDGVYRTDDGGKTWRKIGLEDTQTISRIVIHPTDPNTIYVAALGHVYGPSRARGVYKTTDGGKAWQLVLPGTDRAGAVDLTMDPQHPEILLATIWDGWRTPYLLNSGGDASRMYRSTDGGRTWTDISRKPGLPTGMLGKIGVSISPIDDKRYWAIVEAADGGLFRSDDAGETWQKVNENRNWRQRAWYYTHVYADTKSRDAVYVLNVGMGRSTDGGKGFTSLNPSHGDNHDLWIAPNDANRMIEANDGGANISTDGGRTWTNLAFPTGQFYHVMTDNAFPYHILGAQQDNSSVRIASRTQSGGIGSADWTGTAGGESGYISAKPNDPDVVFGGNYGGNIDMQNHRTGENRSVDPWPDNPMGHGAVDLAQRFQWTFPIVFSPIDPNMLYTCSQYVLMSTNNGQSWKQISPDLTRNDPATLQSSGGPITKDNTAVEYYGTVFTVAESPKKKGLIWAGSDDGLIHITQDGGKTWQDVTPPDMPHWGKVSMIDPSPFDPGTAYAAIDNHCNDDYAPYAFKTRDFGKTWTKIVGGLSSFVRVVREDHRQKGLLYAGTETGAWVSFDDGGHWQTLQMNLPICPVHDLMWKDDDLIAATHGRAFWVLDDLTPLQQMAASQASGIRFFQPKDAYNVRWGGGGRRRRGTATVEPAGENPMSGLVLNYYLPDEAKDLKFEVSDSAGKVIQTVTGAPHDKGFQRTSTFFQYPSFRGFQGMILWSGFPSPIAAPPGEYTVTMISGSYRQSYKFHWLRDPRLEATDKDLVEKFTFQQRIVARLNEANDAVARIRVARGLLTKALADATAKGDVTALKPLMEKLQGGLTAVEEAIYQTKNQSGQDPLNYPIRLNDKLAGVFSNVSGGNYRPTDQSYVVFDLLSKQLGVQLSSLMSLLDKDLKAVNVELGKLGVPAVVVPEVKASGGGGGDFGFGGDDDGDRDRDRDRDGGF